MEYDILKPWLTLDPWQKKYIETEGNCFLLCGRQSGKTAAASIKFGKRAANNENRIILMIAFTEKQAYALFFKTLMYLEANYPKMIITKGKKKPTKHEINLKNGSKIMCYAAGLDGGGLRTFTVTDLVVDEAAEMSREVFTAVIPMLSVTGGSLDILSTPRGAEGYFYDCSKRKDFEKFYVSAEDCPRHKKEHLEIQKEYMSNLEYAQEYLAVFLSDLKRVFTDEWIREVCILKRRDSIIKDREYYMGVDIARMGDDLGTIEIFDYMEMDNIEQVENIITRKQLTTQTEDKIIYEDNVWNCMKIGIDAGSGSLGVGILDHLLREDQTKRKVIDLDNKKRLRDREGNSTTRILSEDMYNNVVALGERRKLKLLNDESVIESLKSVQFEHVIKFGHKTTVRFFGRNTHVAEGIKRGLWFVKEKSLKVWIDWV